MLEFKSRISTLRLLKKMHFSIYIFHQARHYQPSELCPRHVKPALDISFFCFITENWLVWYNK